MIEPQRRLLSDGIRNAAFAEALRRAIQPGRTTVADLGTGTGFLAILAERAGAKSVWACDLHAGVIGLARQVAKENGCKRISFAVGHSTGQAPPTLVDLVVAEVLGHFAGEEHIVESLTDARRWLAPGGRCIPGKVEQVLCPVVGDAVQNGIDIFANPQGVDLGAARRIALNNGYVRTLAPGQLLGQGRAGTVIDTMRFPGKEASRRNGSASWELPATAVHGLCLWWQSELVPGVILSTSPLEPTTHWEQIYLPLLKPLLAKAGDRLEATISFDTRFDKGCVVHWRGRLLRGGRAVAEFALDNRTGFLG